MSPGCNRRSAVFTAEFLWLCCFLAGLILVVEMILNTSLTDLVVLLSAMVPVAIVARRVVSTSAG